MKAITARYVGPGNVRGSRFKATDEDGNSAIVPYNYALSAEANHDRAALALCEKMGWTGNLYRGGLKNGNCYVWGPGKSKTAQVES